MMKTSELTGLSLNWAVAKCEGWTEFDEDLQAFTQHEIDGCGWLSLDYFHPSENWAQGGPIVEREKMTLSYDEDSQTYSAYVSLFRQRGMSNRTRWRSGPTPLVAAMRCLVASKLGDEVEIPEELLK